MSQPYSNFESEQTPQNPSSQPQTSNPQPSIQVPVQGIPIITSQIQNDQGQMQPNQQVVIIQQVSSQQQQQVDQPNIIQINASHQQRLTFLRMVTLIQFVKYLIAFGLAYFITIIPNSGVFYFDVQSCGYKIPTYTLLFCYIFFSFWVKYRYVRRENVANSKIIFLISSLLFGLMLSPFYSTLVTFGEISRCDVSLFFDSVVFLAVWQGFLMIGIFYTILVCSPSEILYKDLIIRFLVAPLVFCFLFFITYPILIFYVIVATLVQIPFIIQLAKIANGEKGKLRSEQYFQGFLYSFGYSIIPCN